MITVDKIWFNWDTASGNTDAINIRTDWSTPVLVPEYVREDRSEPSAYVTSSIGANTVQIRAQFSGGEANTDVQIGATGDGTPLGDVTTTTVHFDASGTATQMFDLANTTFTTATISPVTTTWQWTAGSDDIGTTSHRSFILVDLPAAPWVQTVNDPLLPWSTALDVACAWADGTATDAATVAALTQSLNGCGATYDPSASFLLFTPLRLDLSSFLQSLALYPGVDFTMNCADCGAAVSTLARLLGVAYESGEIRADGGGLLVTNLIRGLGTAGWRSWSWAFHEVCWSVYQDDGGVYDASAWLHDATPAGYLSLGLQYDTQYEPALVAAGGTTLPQSDVYGVR